MRPVFPSPTSGRFKQVRLYSSNDRFRKNTVIFYNLLNKRPMGHIAHLRTQFIQLYHNTNLNTLHPSCFVPSLVKIGSMVLEKNIFKFPRCLFTIPWLFFLLEKGMALHLNKRESPPPCQVWLKNGQWFQRIRFINIFLLFCNYLL